MRLRTLLAVVPAILFLAVPSAALATTLQVTTTADGSNGACTPALCTLRDAITHAGANDTVHVPASASPYTLTLGDLIVNKDLTIEGDGPSSTVISGDNAWRVFTITGGSTASPIAVKIEGLRITDGNANSTVSSTLSAGRGGGIYQDFFTALTLDRVSVDHNVAQAFGLQQVNGGGIASSGNSLTITNSTVAHDSTSDPDDLQEGPDNESGGGIAILETGPPPTITNTTIADNSTPGEGGGLVTAATFPVSGGSTATLLNDTITANSAGLGEGGIFLATGNWTVKNTIVAQNTAAAAGNCGPFAPTSGDLGHNLSTDSSCGFTQTSDLHNVAQPGLGPLQDNGGSIDTVALLPGSPAINAGDNTGCPATDERGVSRPQGTSCDIGAFELELPPATLAPSVTTEPATNAGLATATLHGTVNPEGLATTYQFQYGTSTAYGKSVPVPDPTVGSDSTVHQVASVISGLRPGKRYHFRIVATNSRGVGTGRDQMFTTVPRVLISHASQSHTRWREGNQLASISRRLAPVGTTFKFTLNAAGAVRFAFTQPGKGRTAKRGCVAANDRNRNKPKCAPHEAMSFTGHPGLNSVRFAGRISRSKKLEPGKWTLVVSATTPGLGSTSARLDFTIVK